MAAVPDLNISVRVQTGNAIHEISRVNSAFATLRAQLSSALPDPFASLNAHATTAVASVTGVSTALSSLSAGAATASAAIGGIGTAIAGLGAGATGSSAAMSAIVTALMGIGASSATATAGMTGLGAVMAGLGGSAATASAGMVSINTSMLGLGAHATAAASGMTGVGTALAGLATSTAAARTSIITLSTAMAGLSTHAAAVATAMSTIGAAMVTLGAQTATAMTGLSGLGAAITGLGTQATAATGAITTLTTELTRASTASTGLYARLGGLKTLIMGLGGIVLAHSWVPGAIEMEEALLDVRRAANVTKEEAAALGEQFKELGVRMGYSGQRIAALATEAAKAGIAKEDLAQFAEVASIAAMNFDMLPEEAGASMGVLKNILKLGVEDMENFVGAVNYMADQAAASERNVIQALMLGGSGGVQMGLGATDVAAIATSLLNVGATAEQAGTAMRSLFSSIQEAAVDTKGKAGKTLRLLVGDIDAFKKKMQTDAAGAIRQLITSLSQLDQESKQLASTNIFGSGLQAENLSKLSGNVQEFNRILDLGKKSPEEYAKALQEVTDLKMGSTASMLEGLRVLVGTLGDELGQIFLPTVRDVVQGLTTLTTGIREVIKTTESWKLKLGTLVIALVALKGPLTALVTGMGGLISGMMASITASSSMAGALGALLGPLGVAAIAVGGLATAWLGVRNAAYEAKAAAEAAAGSQREAQALSIAQTKSAEQIDAELQAAYGKLREARKNNTQFTTETYMGGKYGDERKTRISGITKETEATMHQIAVLKRARAEQEKLKKARETTASSQEEAAKRNIVSELQEESGGASAKAAANEAAALAKARLNAELSVIRDGIQRQKAALERQLKDNLISYQDYYKKKTELELADIDAQIRNTQTAMRSADAAERVRLEAQLTILQRKRAEVQEANARAAIEAEKELNEELDKCRIKLAQLTNADDTAARVREITQAYQGLLDKLTAAGRTGDADLVRKLINVEAADARLQSLEKRWNATVERMRVAQETVEAQHNAGLITELESSKQIVNLQKQAAAQLRTMLPLLEQAAAAIGSDEAISKLEGLKNQILQLETATDAVAQRINTQFKDAFSGLFSDLMTDAESFGDALLNFARNILNTLAQMVAQQFVEKLATSFNFGGDGIGGIFSKMFGWMDSNFFNFGQGLFGGGNKQGAEAQRQQNTAQQQGETTLLSGATSLLSGAMSLITGGTMQTTAATELMAAGSMLGTSATSLMTAATSLMSAAGASGGSSFLSGMGGAIGGMFAAASGGYVTGPGTSTSDSIPARLSAGEYVIRAAAVRKYGLAFFDGLNSLKERVIPQAPLRFADGGLVPEVNVSNNTGGATVKNNVNLVVYDDPQRIIDSAFSTPAGEDAFVVLLGKNPRRYRQILGVT